MQGLQQELQGGFISFGDDFHCAIREIADKAGQSQTAGLALCEGAKADPLHFAADDSAEGGILLAYLETPFC
jgi:hypothetical protein